MGRLYYGNGTEAIEMPDRTLAHLRVVATTKLRRSESFSVSWKHPDGVAGGRSTIWLHCSIPLRFEFDAAEVGRAGPRPPGGDGQSGILVRWPHDRPVRARRSSPFPSTSPARCWSVRHEHDHVVCAAARPARGAMGRGGAGIPCRHTRRQVHRLHRINRPRHVRRRRRILDARRTLLLVARGAEGPGGGRAEGEARTGHIRSSRLPDGLRRGRASSPRA